MGEREAIEGRGEEKRGDRDLEEFMNKGREEKKGEGDARRNERTSPP